MFKQLTSLGKKPQQNAQTKAAFKAIVNSNNHFQLGQSSLKDKSSIKVQGKDNSLIIADHVKGRLIINMLGSNSQVVVEDDVNIIGTLEIFIGRGNSVVKIGKGSTFQGHVRLFNHEPSGITIGADCMFGGDILATTSDMHAIYDADNVRINNPASIIFGTHVWVGAAVRILKGVNIGGGSMVGMSSLVAKGTYPENCIIAGNPAKIIRESIRWTRELP